MKYNVFIPFYDIRNEINYLLIILCFYLFYYKINYLKYINNKFNLSLMNFIL